MRVYLSLGRDDLVALAAGEAVSAEQIVAVSEDEEDELAATEQAAEPEGAVAVAAEVEALDRSVTLEQVAAFHVEIDGTGDLAWYARQEIDQVIDLLT